jgi:hypothetical protein
VGREGKEVINEPAGKLTSLKAIRLGGWKADKLTSSPEAMELLLPCGGRLQFPWQEGDTLPRLDG